MIRRLSFTQRNPKQLNTSLEKFVCKAVTKLSLRDPLEPMGVRPSDGGDYGPRPCRIEGVWLSPYLLLYPQRLLFIDEFDFST